MPHDAASYLVVFVTCPVSDASRLAREVVQASLAACVNIVPAVRSIYRWKGEICDEEEALLVMKSRASLFEPLREKVIALHPYEVPEVIALPIVDGHPAYLEWLEACTRP